MSRSIWVASVYHRLYCLHLGFRVLSSLIVTIMFWYDVTIFGAWSGLIVEPKGCLDEVIVCVVMFVILR